MSEISLANGATLITDVDCAQIQSGAGAWLYNFPIVPQVTQINCWAAYMASILTGFGRPKTMAQVLQECNNFIST